MSALKGEVEKVQAGEAGERSLGLIDCGQASELTKGTTVLLFFESAPAPYNWLYTS